MKFVLVAMLGVAGVSARYLLDLSLKREPGSFPWTIFAINIAGSFLAGAIYAVSTEKLSADWKEALLIGLCGGLTTFSAFSLETVVLWQSGYWVKALCYLTLSPLLGCAAVFGALAAFRNPY